MPGIHRNKADCSVESCIPGYLVVRFSRPRCSVVYILFSCSLCRTSAYHSKGTVRGWSLRVVSLSSPPKISVYPEGYGLLDSRFHCHHRQRETDKKGKCLLPGCTLAIDLP